MLTGSTIKDESSIYINTLQDLLNEEDSTDLLDQIISSYCCNSKISHYYHDNQGPQKWLNKRSRSYSMPSKVTVMTSPYMTSSVKRQHSVHDMYYSLSLVDIPESLLVDDDVIDDVTDDSSLGDAFEYFRVLTPCGGSEEGFMTSTPKRKNTKMMTSSVVNEDCDFTSHGYCTCSFCQGDSPVRDNSVETSEQSLGFCLYDEVVKKGFQFNFLIFFCSFFL